VSANLDGVVETGRANKTGRVNWYVRFAIGTSKGSSEGVINRQQITR
jgi:hypothetical protein